MNRTWRRLNLLVAAGAALLATGCGAAYYGTVLGIFATQKDKKTIVTTAPDGAVAAVDAPPLATLVVGTELVQDAQGRSGLPVLSVDFPEGHGTSSSDRGAGETTTATDQLILSINGDEPQTITLDPFTTGTDVAADIQAKVRLLTPVDPAVPLEAYTLFTCTFDLPGREYTLRSGAPGGESSVVVNPPDALPQNNTPDPAEVTAETLRLGVANNGIERSGAENIHWTIFNHGTDVLAGGEVNVYLSRTKGVDDEAFLIRTLSLPRSVEVATARRFTSVNQEPPETLLAVADTSEVLFPPGQYFLIVELAGGASEEVGDDNVRCMVGPVQVNAPFGGFPPVGGGPPPLTDPLDFIPVQFDAPIAVVAGAQTVCSLGISNHGAAVVGNTDLTVDVILNSTDDFVPPRAVLDPDETFAGFFVNPIDAARQTTLVIDTTGPALPTASVSGSTVTVALDPTVATVSDLVQVVDSSATARALITIDWDGVGSSSGDTLGVLFANADLTSTTISLPTGGRLIHRGTVTFAPAAEQQTVQTFVLDVDIPVEDRWVGLPQRHTTFVRITPPVPATPEDDSNNVRRAPNYTRIYGESTATFDNGVLLPTFRDTDFARLEPVTQRPVNTGSIVQGQQRVFRFEIPNTISLNESQLLIVVRTDTFDPHIELLDSTSRPIARSDDSALGLGSLLYLPVAANQNQLVFYLVISNALLDDSNIGGAGASFDLTISVNPRQPEDPSLSQAVAQEEFFDARDEAVAEDPAAGADQNRKLIPFDLAQEKSEMMFVLPARARVRFRTFPVFGVGVTPIITRFNEGEVPTALQFQAEVDPATLEIVYRPSNGTIDASHVLKPGVYTVTFNSLEGPDPTTFLLDLDVEFIPEDVD